MGVAHTTLLTMKPSVISAARPLFSLLFLILIVLVPPVLTDESFFIPEQTLQRMEQQFGKEARTRLLAWQHLIRTTVDSEQTKLERVNRFMNTNAFIADTDHWQQEDYWATPIEFIASRGGDCEDFAIAKFFTLLKMGVDEHRLALTYVKAVHLNQAHMVLTYYPVPGAEPLVLDNLIDAIKPSSQRTDLVPVYSLNGSGLWLAKQRGKGKQIGNNNRLKRWRELLDRISSETP
ncbi:transglutaminase-like cysteine peptidase [Desulfobulbus oligotrophicus]|uniref:Transglutaminase-like cysteine peptidase n=1 Tax=Desulfobulbus oligotrophicus TaxID=1909699 RepID=A0A7T5VAN1_9BACT|nr:transglutaminase-like cysteine peptidase [Desulfobulbus oligotrophicus]QQG64394.1 transglutaminase-like cysteine peptidase [Desulfobulbus oligotrophicus]